jgi:hypothetical protein
LALLCIAALAVPGWISPPAAIHSGLSPAAPRTASSAQGWAAIPLAARAALSRGLGADEQSFFAERASSGAARLNNTTQRLHVTVTAGRIAVSGRRGLVLALSAPAVGRGAARTPLSRTTLVSVKKNEVEFASAGVDEWYANGPMGVEQGFTLGRRPAGSGPLTISQIISPDAVARVAPGGEGVTFSPAAASSHPASISYTNLLVTGANGGQVPARFAVSGSRLTITIADAHATYPLRVDPEFEQSAELTASDGASEDWLGNSLAISGRTIVAGAPKREISGEYARGVLYVFTEPSTGWANATQTAELTSSDGAGGDFFADTVAISGQTIVAGTNNHTVGSNTDQGAAYVFTEPAGGWVNATQTAELSASNIGANSGFGSGVAIQGQTIVVGAPGQGGAGAVYVYKEPAGGWANTNAQAAELTASDGVSGDGLGGGVAISGKTIVASAIGRKVGSNAEEGAMYVFSEPSGGWANATQTAELTATNATAKDLFSYALAISGPTIVTGTPFHKVGSNAYEGAVWVFSEPPGGWVNATQTAELSASDGGASSQLGNSVAVSGRTIVAGANEQTVEGVQEGVVDEYLEPADGWVNATQTNEMSSATAEAGEGFGYTAAMSGATIATGTYTRNVGGVYHAGMVYAFHPTVTSSTMDLTLSSPSIAANGTSTSTATVTVDDTSGNPVVGDTVGIASSGAQTVGPVTEGTTPGSYEATITSSTNAESAAITATDTTVSPSVSASATLTQTKTAETTIDEVIASSPPPAPGAAPLSAPAPATAPLIAPAPAPAPSNTFTFTGDPASSTSTGSVVKLSVSVPGPGAIEALATHSNVSDWAAASSSTLEPGAGRIAWGRASVVVKQAGTVKVTLFPNALGKRLIARDRRYGRALHLRVWVSYIPTGGTRRSFYVTVRVLKARSR